MSFSFRESGAAVGLGVAEGAADGLVEGLAEWLDCDGSGEPIGLWEADGCREAVAVLGAGEALGSTIPTEGDGASGECAGVLPPQPAMMRAASRAAPTSKERIDSFSGWSGG
ncbi:MAG: hypothetical protein ACJ77N_05830 [Chloroflexota bacterium]